MAGLIQDWSEATGKPALFIQMASVEEYDALYPIWGHIEGANFRLWEEFGDQAWAGEDVLTKEDLGLKEADFVGTRAGLKTMDWSSV